MVDVGLEEGRMPRERTEGVEGSGTLCGTLRGGHVSLYTWPSPWDIPHPGEPPL